MAKTPALQKKIVRIATYNDSPPVIGPLAHTPLFFKLKILNIFDIYKLQLGKLVNQSVNVNISPAHKVIKFNLLNYIAIIPDLLNMEISMLVVLELLDLV